MEKEIMEIDVRDKIVQHLKDDDRSLLWLHEKRKFLMEQYIHVLHKGYLNLVRKI